MSQAAIVELLNAAAERLGTGEHYEYYHVSRMEKGSITFEDAAAWLQIDPARKANEPPRWQWLALGEKRVRQLAPRSTDRPSRASGDD